MLCSDEEMGDGGVAVKLMLECICCTICIIYWRKLMCTSCNIPSGRAASALAKEGQKLHKWWWASSVYLLLWRTWRSIGTIAGLKIHVIEVGVLNTLKKSFQGPGKENMVTFIAPRRCFSRECSSSKIWAKGEHSVCNEFVRVVNSSSVRGWGSALQNWFSSALVALFCSSMRSRCFSTSGPRATGSPCCGKIVSTLSQSTFSLCMAKDTPSKLSHLG